MIPFGPRHPDKAGVNAKVCLQAINCLPAVNGYAPLKGPVPSSAALGNECLGAAVVFDDDGDVYTFAGDTTKLYRLTATSSWDDVSRTTGGAYSTGGGERWQFASSGSLVIATTITEPAQKFLLGTSTDFEPLGGVPPRARYIATVRDFVVLGGLFGDERTIAWSEPANAEHWTPGTNSADRQTFQDGGPVRGIIGGETGYVFQAEKVQRMVFVPGSETIFQFDEVEGGRGLIAPYSLVKWGNMAYYMASDGLYRFSLGAGASEPLGVGKWARDFLDDIKKGTESTILGGIDPVGRVIKWAYTSKSNPNATRDRVLIYDWSIDETTIAEIDVTAIAQILTTGVTLDTMNSFGNLDTLQFSLDSPFWRGGASLLGVFRSDKTLSVFSGDNMRATFLTADGELPARAIVKGLRPHIDTRAIQAEIATREAEGDSVSWGNLESMEETGIISTWASGWCARARLTVPQAARWTKFTGITPVIGKIGKR